LLPIFSWLALGGRCRTCAYAIGQASLWHEVAFAVLGGLLGWAIGLRWYSFPLLLALLIICAGLVLISHSHLRKTPRKPNR
jgi:prepilin signal peptidase PulO-like enzyme (type II secretory pathway)